VATRITDDTGRSVKVIIADPAAIHKSPVSNLAKPFTGCAYLNSNTTGYKRAQKWQIDRKQ